MQVKMKKPFTRHQTINLGQNYLLVDLRDFSSDLGSRGRKKKKTKL